MAQTQGGVQRLRHKTALYGAYTVEQPLEDMLAHHNVGGGLVTVCLGLRAKGGRRTHENGVGGDGSDAELTGLLSLTAE